MSAALRLRSVIVEGLGLVATRNGVVLGVAFACAQLFNVALVFGAGTMYLPLGTVPGGSAVAPTPGEELPALISLQATILASTVGAIVTAPISIVGIRTFVGGERDRIPDAYLFYHLGRATLRVYFAGLVVFVVVLTFVWLPILVGLGLLAAGITGTPLLVGVGGALLVGFVAAAIGWVSLLFVNHEIAVEDAGVRGALVRSWRRVAGTRIRLFALAVCAAVIQGLVPTLFTPLGDLLGQVVSIPIIAAVGVAWMAILARAYRVLHDDPNRALARLDA